MIQDRTNWTEEEDEKLRVSVILKREKNWDKISKEIQNKTPSQCKNRWKNALSPSIVKVSERRKWVPEEDDSLSKLVKKYGTKNWRIIASHLRGRLPKQCRERWINHLDPSIVKGRLTEKEWKVVLDAHDELGNRWSEIAKLIPGRTPNQIKNHWHAMVRKTKKRKFKEYKDCETPEEGNDSLIGSGEIAKEASYSSDFSSSRSPDSISEEIIVHKNKKIKLNSFSKLDALIQIAEYMYQAEAKSQIMNDLSSRENNLEMNTRRCSIIDLVDDYGSIKKPFGLMRTNSKESSSNFFNDFQQKLIPSENGERSAFKMKISSFTSSGLNF